MRSRITVVAALVAATLAVLAPLTINGHVNPDPTPVAMSAPDRGSAPVFNDGVDSDLAIFRCRPKMFCITTGQNAGGYIYEWGWQAWGESGCWNLGIAPNGINYNDNAEWAMNNARPSDIMILYEGPNGTGNRIVLYSGESFNLIPRNVHSSICFI